MKWKTQQPEWDKNQVQIHELVKLSPIPKRNRHEKRRTEI